MGPTSPRRHPYRVHASRGPHAGDEGADAHGASGCTGGAAPPILHHDDPESLFSSPLLPTPSSSRPKRVQPLPTLANPAPTTLHEGAPFLLTLMTLANALCTHACVPPLVRFPMMGEGERVIELVRNELQIAAILVVQKDTISIPHAHAPGVGPGGMKRAHALHLHMLKLLATPSHGPEDEATNISSAQKLAPVPVLLALSPEAFRCSTRCDTAVLLAKLHLYGESTRFRRALVIPMAKIIEHKRLRTTPRNGHAKEVVPRALALLGARTFKSPKRWRLADRRLQFQGVGAATSGVTISKVKTRLWQSGFGVHAKIDDTNQYALPSLVIKIAARRRSDDLVREAWFYEEMEDIQGAAIARCYGFFTAEIEQNSQVLDWEVSDADYDEEVDVREDDGDTDDTWNLYAWTDADDLVMEDFSWEVVLKSAMMKGGRMGASGEVYGVVYGPRSIDLSPSGAELLVVPYSKWGPEYNRRTERWKQQNRQSMEASSKLRLATEAHRDSCKWPRSGGSARRVYSQEPEARNPKPKEPVRDTWRHAHNSSLKRRMSHVGETVVTSISKQQTATPMKRDARQRTKPHYLPPTPTHPRPNRHAIAVTSSLLIIINLPHGGRADSRPGAGMITLFSPAPASRRAVVYTESAGNAGWFGDGPAEVTEADPGGAVVMEWWDKGRWGRGFKKRGIAPVVTPPRSAFISQKEEHVPPSDLVSLATESQVLTARGGKDTTDSLSGAENGWLGGYAGWGAGKAGEEVRRLIKAICSARVAGDGECGSGGRGVGVGGGRMSSTHDRGGNEARWKRWDCRECVLAGSGATRPADGERAGRLASVTPR
ncbi:hypothetical protein JB92DRAFT_2827017 [Gautieria morchelliformis]|nr:hypothetical protein JB92DRAFT_2827017 [Gautieria morchelliformis]